MTRLVLPVFVAFCGLFIGLQPLSAQTPPATADDLTLRPGDTITWAPTAPHKLRLGGPPVTHSGAQVTLTPFTDVLKVLDVTPTLTADAQGIATTPGVTQVTATVRPDAATSGVTAFNFTCGFPPHYGLMVTVPFKIVPKSNPPQPAKSLQIVPASGPIWVLKTPQGDRRLTLP